MSNSPQIKGWTAEELKEKVRRRGALTYASVERQFELIDQLASFEFGRFLLETRGGLNGYWFHRLVSDDTSNMKGLEDYFYNRAPIVKATRQRFGLFKNIIQKQVRDGVVLASVPCGYMGDLLTLDYTGVSDFKLIGIDTDLPSIKSAQDLARKKKLPAIFREEDAWEMTAIEEFDLISSYSLNFYEKSEERVIRLFRTFHQALKKNGFLVTSFLTPPPGTSHRTEWRMEKLSLEDVLIQKIFVTDLLDAPWQSFCTTDQMNSQLTQAGFADIQFIYDDAHLMPTVCARK
jgi:SAM-dependent methyltransferase